MLRKDIANENLKLIKMEGMEFENKSECLEDFYRGLEDMRRSEKCKTTTRMKQLCVK